MLSATQPNETWAMDFVHDPLATGNKIRVLTVVDLFSRYSPVIDPRFSYRAEDVVRALERTCSMIGYPKTIRVDQGSEFVSRDLDLVGLTPTASRSTSHGQVSLRTMRSSKPSTVASGPSV